MKVALLDSGIGGWSFLTKIENRYPQHTYLYFADQKNCPYGNKSLSELEEIANEWINLFKVKEIDVLIIACNTMTAWFKQSFQDKMNIPVFGTTDGLQELNITDKKMVLLATVKTVQSQWYNKVFPDSDLCLVGNKWLAKSIEEHFMLSQKELTLLKNEVEEEVDGKWERMILGCTHYPLVLEQLKMIWPGKMFIDPAVSIVEKLRSYLDTVEVDNNNIIMYTTGELELLQEQVRSFFNEKKRCKITSERI